jgi:hypothetical protein
MILVLYFFVTTITSPINDLIDAKEDIVNRMTEKVIDTYINRYNYDCNCAISQCYSIVNPSALSSTSEFGSDPSGLCKCNRLVNFNRPTYYFPYDMNTDHSFVCWSQQLDEQYHITYETDSEIIWQYISSPTGTISIYPGTSQIECNDNNYLSVYNRPWYISGPKSIVFMIDISSEIIKSFAKQVINLLSIYDYFGVVVISAHIKVLTGSTLIKASISNRQNIVILIDKLDSEENADYAQDFLLPLILLAHLN